MLPKSLDISYTGPSIWSYLCARNVVERWSGARVLDYQQPRGINSKHISRINRKPPSAYSLCTCSNFLPSFLSFFFPGHSIADPTDSIIIHVLVLTEKELHFQTESPPYLPKGIGVIYIPSLTYLALSSYPDDNGGRQ